MMEARTATGTPRWGMVVDINRCVGCQTCTIACKHANDTLPGVQWRRVLDVEQGRFPDVERLFLVTGCQHCAEPPCVPVCPTGATRQREDGLVTQDYDICIGCAYCAVACPYDARTIVHEQRGYYGRETVQERATAHPERLGVAQKCNFCQDRVDAGLANGLKPGIDPEATPACSAACIAKAIDFGDFNDPQSNVSLLARDNPSFRMHEQLGTEPQIRYLYTTPAVPGRDAEAEDEERESDPANPLVGGLQTLWDWRAAMNWCFGGVSSGLAIMAWVAAQTGVIEAAKLPVVFVAAALLMAVGLFFVFLKIGRQLRFWRAILRPQTSWMTRELYAVAVFYPAVAASFLWPQPALFALTALAALAFLLCQAKILHLARGIPAWRAPLVPWMIAATGLLEGYGALGVALLFVVGAASPGWVLAGMLLAAANFLLWRQYVASARREGIVPLSRRALEALAPWIYVLGHALPVVLLAVALLIPVTTPASLALAGLAAIAGSAAWKFALIVNAGYRQGFALAKLPQRGSGTRAAPPRLAPVSSDYIHRTSEK